MKTKGAVEPAAPWAETEEAEHICQGVRGEGGDDHQQQHHRPGGVKQLLNGVDEPTDGSAEHGGDSGSSARCDNHAAKRHRCPKPAGHLPGHGAAHLNSGTLWTEGKPAADGNDAGHEFHQANPQAHGHISVTQETHDVGDAGATCCWGQIADQPGRHHASDGAEGGEHQPGRKVIQQIEPPIAQQVDAAGEQQTGDGGTESGERQSQNHHQPAAFQQPPDAAARAQEVASLFGLAQGWHR